MIKSYWSVNSNTGLIGSLTSFWRNDMFRKTFIGAGLLVGSLSFIGTASAQGNCYGNYGYQQAYRVPVYRAPIYVTPAYRPVQVYRPPVYGYSPVSRGVNVNIGVGGGYPRGIGYGSGYGYGSGFGYGPGISVGRFRF